MVKNHKNRKNFQLFQQMLKNLVHQRNFIKIFIFFSKSSLEFVECRLTKKSNRVEIYQTKGVTIKTLRISSSIMYYFRSIEMTETLY